MSLRAQVIFKTQNSWVKIMCFKNTSAKPSFHLLNTEWRGRFLCSWKKNCLILLSGTHRENNFQRKIPGNTGFLCELLVTFFQYIYVLVVSFSRFRDLWQKIDYQLHLYIWVLECTFGSSVSMIILWISYFQSRDRDKTRNISIDYHWI